MSFSINLDCSDSFKKFEDRDAKYPNPLIDKAISLTGTPTDPMVLTKYSTKNYCTKKVNLSLHFIETSWYTHEETIPGLESSRTKGGFIRQGFKDRLKGFPAQPLKIPIIMLDIL